jgi:23S rRNA (uracil1939-C5)-methyltransferase
MTRSDLFLLSLIVVGSSVFEGSSAFTALSRNSPPHTLLHATARRPKNQKGRKGSNNRGQRRRPEPEPRPVLTDYDFQRDPRINQARLTDSIGCEHFGTCPGCVVDKKVGTVDIIKSAKFFFSSTAVRKRRLDVKSDDVVTEESDDGFYQVVIPAPLTGWRTQAKLAVASRGSAWEPGCSFGLYSRGTHNVLEIPSCEVHHPSINRAVDSLVRATQTINIAAYKERSGEGGLRYVQFQVERTTGKISLTLVWHAENLKGTQPALTRLIKELQRIEPDLWHNIWCHCNDGPGNNIFARNADRWHLMVGPEFIREPFPVGDKGWLYFSPLAFRQGNMDGFDILAIDVAKTVPGGSRVCELYAGIGLLGLTALTYHDNRGSPLKWVRCSDENPANPRCFERTVNSLPASITGKPGEGRKERQEQKESVSEELTLGEMARLAQSGAPDPFETEREKTSYAVASAKQALYDGQALGADVLIVDPPRKGLEPEVLDELCKPYNSKQELVERKDMLTVQDHRVNWANDVRTLIYVSCGFEALARDCESLLRSNSGWMLESANGYVLFPGSDHVETLAVFQRR